MADRQTEFLVAFESTGTSLRTFLSALKKDTRATFDDMQSAADRLQLFAKVQADAKKAADAFFETKKRVDDFRKAVEAIEAQGGTVGKELAKQIREAEKAFASATKEFDKQKTSLKDLRTGMQATERAATLLAAEQRKVGEEMAKQATSAFLAQRAAEKLAESTKLLAQQQAAVALAFQANKDFLGFKQFRDIQPEIEKARLAFQQLAASGKLSFAELGLAQNALGVKIREIRASVGTLGQAFAQARNGLLAFGAATAGIVAGATSAAASYREFAQQLAAIGSIAPVTTAQLDAIGVRVRDMARAFGVDAVNSAKALYDIIGSGVEDPAKALIVLEQATRAAVAGLTTVDVAARLGVQTMNAYGLQVNDVGRIFDIIFKAVQDGVITFADFAANLGEVSPTAVAAGVSLERVAAAFVVLTRSGVNASEAATQIRSAIQNFAAPAPEAREKLRELGIELGNFESVIEQISKKDLSFSQLREVVSDVRALKAVQILTQQFDLFRESIGNTVNSAGAMASAYAKLAATPQARVDRFNASMRELNLTIGEFVTRSAPAIEFLTNLVNGFNNLTPATKSLAVEIVAVTVGLTAAYALFRVLAAPINAIVGALASLGTAAAAGAGALTAASVAMGALQVGIAALLGFKFGEQLYEQFAWVRQIGDEFGVLAGKIENTLGFAQARIRAFFTGNTEAAARATETYRLNAEILDGMWTDAVTGAAEKSRQLTAEQQRLGDSFSRSREAITTAATAAQAALSTVLSSIKALIDANENALGASRAKLTQLVEGLREQLALITKGSQDSIKALTESTQAQIAVLGTLQQTELARVRETIEIQRQAATERLALLTKFAADTKTAFEAEAAARLAIAGKSKIDIEHVERELTLVRKGTLTEVVDAFRAHINELVAIQTGHLDKIRQIEDQRRGINESIENQIRDLRRGTLTAYEGYADRIRQIDETMSKGRQALAQGDTKLAQDYANKAIGLTGQIAQKVEEGGRVIVGQFEAAGRATSKLREAQDLLNKSLSQEEQAAKAGAGAAAAAHTAALGKLKEYEQELDRVSAKAAEGASLQIKIKVDEIDKELVNLQALVAQRELLAPLKLVLDGANQQLESLKRELAAGGIPVNLTAKLDNINAAIKAVQDQRPELTVDTQKALKAVADVAASARAIDDLRPKLTVSSNVSDVQADIERLKLPTSSTHTIYVERVERNSLGGPVGAAMTRAAAGWPVQEFARGGQVFRKPPWDKVPGSGNKDTVAAALQSGSYVIKKKASQFYGDGTMRAVAQGRLGLQRFAGGGRVRTRWDDLSESLRPSTRGDGTTIFYKADGTEESPFFGDVKAGTKESHRSFAADDVFGEPTLPSDPKELRRKILGYAGEVVIAARQIDGAQYWAPVIRALGLEVKQYENQPTLQNLGIVLNRARGIGLNLGITGPIRRGFDVDGRRFRKTAAKAPPGLANARLYSYEFFGAGGAPRSGDTVPAMVTPGEWVIQPRAVRAMKRRFGDGIMDAINNMQAGRPKLAIAGPKVKHFATGGPVGFDDEFARRSLLPNSDIGRRTLTPETSAVAGNVFKMYFQLPPDAILTPQNFVRYLKPWMDEVTRRSRD